MACAGDPNLRMPRWPYFGDHAAGGIARIEQPGSVHTDVGGVGFSGGEIFVGQMVRGEDVEKI